MADESYVSDCEVGTVGQVGSWLAAASHEELLSFAGHLGLSPDAPEFALDASGVRTECFRVLSVFPRTARAAHASYAWSVGSEGEGLRSPWADVLPPPVSAGANAIRFDAPSDIELPGSVSINSEGGRSVAGGGVAENTSPVFGAGPEVDGALPHTPLGNATLLAELNALRTSVKSVEARFATQHASSVARQAQVERVAADAARAAHEDFISKSNRGLLDSTLLPVQLSARMQHKATAFELSPSFEINGWERGEDFVDNCMDSPPSQGLLRACLFDCEMRPDDRARLLRGGGKPTIWSDAPLLSLQDKELLGSALAKADEGMRGRQNSLLKQALPVVRSLDSLASAFEAVGSRDPSKLAESLADLKSQLSDAFHLLSYDLSVLQKERTNALYKRMAAASAGVDEPFEETEWSLLPGTRVSLEDDLVKKAATARSLRKDIKTLTSSHSSFRERGGRGGGGGGADGKRKRKRKRSRSGGRGSGGGEGARHVSQDTGDSGKSDSAPKGGRGGSERGRGRGRGGRGGGRGQKKE